MNRENRHIDTREVPETGLIIEYSQAHDNDVVHETVNELAMLKEQGYDPRLPVKIVTTLKEGKSPTQGEIAEAVADEIQLEEYKRLSDEVSAEWVARKEDVMAKLVTLGLPIQPEYVLRLTQYGVGGEYHLPNVIDANIHEADAEDVVSTVVHETIHLTIENAVEENNIDHWTKERVVDLIFGRFYPERMELQKDPVHADEVREIFDQYYPNVKDAIIEIGKLSR